MMQPQGLLTAPKARRHKEGSSRGKVGLLTRDLDFWSPE